MKAKEDVRYYGGGMVFGGALEDVTRIDLKNLLRDVKQIAKLAGTQRLVLPRQVETVEFTSSKPGETKTVGDFTVKVKEVAEMTAFEIHGPEATIKDLMVRC